VAATGNTDGNMRGTHPDLTRSSLLYSAVNAPLVGLKGPSSSLPRVRPKGRPCLAFAVIPPPSNLAPQPPAGPERPGARRSLRVKAAGPWLTDKWWLIGTFE
jgi:hypothetical protein